MSLYASVTAHAAGYDENVFLDPATRTCVEETGGANFLFVTKDGEVVTPKSDSILPSITRRSLVYVAEHYLGLKVTQRPVKLSELDEFAECGLCGTAAVISRWAGLWTTERKSASQAAWTPWDLLPRSCMIPLQAFRWEPSKRLRMDPQNRITPYNIGLTIIKSEYTQTCV